MAYQNINYVQNRYGTREYQAPSSGEFTINPINPITSGPSISPIQPAEEVPLNPISNTYTAPGGGLDGGTSSSSSTPISSTPISISSNNSGYVFSTNPYTAPEYDNLLVDGELPDNLTLDSHYDSTYMDSLWDYANSTDASPWLELQLKQIASQGATQKDQLERARMGALAEGREDMAMRGGLRSGAAERLASSGMDRKMIESQALQRAILEEENKMRIAEEEARLGVRERMPGYEQGRATYETGIDQGNINTFTGAHTADYNAAMDKYQTDSEIWASLQEAAMEAGIPAPMQPWQVNTQQFNV